MPTSELANSPRAGSARAACSYSQHSFSEESLLRSAIRSSSSGSAGKVVRFADPPDSASPEAPPAAGSGTSAARSPSSESPPALSSAAFCRRLSGKVGPRAAPLADALQSSLGHLELELCSRLDRIESSLQRMHAKAEASDSEKGLPDNGSGMLSGPVPPSLGTYGALSHDAQEERALPDAPLQSAAAAAPPDAQQSPFSMRPEWKDGATKATEPLLVLKNGLSSGGSFYFGTQANLPASEEDERAAEKPWWLVLPSSRTRLCWDLAMIGIIAHDMAVVPITLAFNCGNNWVTSMLFWPVLLFWTFDLPLSFVTGYYRNGRLEVRLYMIAVGYLRSWFLLDVFMVISTWCEVFVTETNPGYLLGRAGKSMRILRVMRSLRILRLAKLRRITENVQDHVTSRYHNILISVVKLILTIIWLNHFIACSWWGLGVNVSNNGENDSWTSHYGFEQQSLGFQYFTSLHWSLTQFTPASMEVSARNLPERIFSVIVLLFAMVAFSSFVSSITAAMTQLRELHTQYDSNISTLRRYLRSHDVSMDLTARIMHCVDYRVSKQKREIQETQVEFLQYLSKPLQMELSSHIFAPALVRHPFLRRFCQVDSEAMRHVCLEAVAELSLAGEDLLFTEGSRCDQMFFLRSGQLRYHVGQRRSSQSDARRWATYDNILEEEEWCCEVSMWCPWMHVGTMIARCMSEVMAVDTASFIRITNSYHMVTSFTSRYAELFLEEMNVHLHDGVMISDMTAVSIETLEEIADKAYSKQCNREKVTPAKKQHLSNEDDEELSV